MKKVEELFSNEFVLKIINKIDGHTHHVEDTKLQVLPADYKEESIKFKIKEYGEKNYKQPDVGPYPSRDALAYGEGKIISPVTGYYNQLGDSDYLSQVVKSVGGLVAVEVYSQPTFDDAFMLYDTKIHGTVIMDKDLNVVYQNFYKPFSVLYKQEDAFKLLHDFGPSVLAFMNPKEFNGDIQKNIQRVFDLRVQHQEEKFVNPAEIEKEKELFDKAFDAMKKEYDAIQEKDAGLEC